MSEINTCLKQFKRQLIVGPLFKWLEAILELFVPLVMASMIDLGIRGENTRHIYEMGAILVGLSVFGLIFALLCQYAAAVASTGFSRTLRSRLFEHIGKLGYEELDHIGSNSLITRMTNDVNQAETALAMFIRLAVRAPFIIIGAAVMALLIDRTMSVIFVVIIPLVSLVLYLVMWRAVPYYNQRQRKLDTVSLITKENLEGSRVIRAFSKNEAERERFEQSAGEVQKIATHVGNLSAILNPAIFTILNGAILAILWFGGVQVNVGGLTQGQIIALVSYTTQISLMLIVLANLIIIFTRASASIKRLAEIFNIKPAMTEGTLLEGNAESPKIEFRDVQFKYPASEEVALDSLNFKVASGMTFGIIGGTGAGKSTLVNLLPRFYDVTSGEILIDGVNVKEYAFTALRKKFGIVAQQAVLFEGTIHENLTMANENATLEELERAIAAAQARNVIEAKEGMDALLEQGGRNLSGGQRQRLTIARALVGNPEILILDDASSALDYATDAALRSALAHYKEGLTVCIVSQRANSVKHADLILVLDEGQVAGLGTHESLLASCSIYQEICESQGVAS
ncbi:MAG: ABC transporter ATP-binding protein/permease [Turicibacter sp.]|nr:ABC transporter ATP-binding protein/permease [Turicibacter sp.]